MHPCVTNGSRDDQLMVSHATQATHGFIYQQKTKVLTNIVFLRDTVVPMLQFFEKGLCVLFTTTTSHTTHIHVKQWLSWGFQPLEGGLNLN